MQVFQNGSRPTRAASAEYFTGTVWMEPIIAAEDPARVEAVLVTFAAGARTFWHTHPLGQTLYVVSGLGRVQVEGGSVREIAPGDVVWIGPGEKHWHGAAPEHAMVHVAMHERQDGKVVLWQEEVAEKDYSAACLV